MVYPPFLDDLRPFTFNILKVTFDVEGRVHFLQIREMEESHRQPQKGASSDPMTTNNHRGLPLGHPYPTWTWECSY